MFRQLDIHGWAVVYWALWIAVSIITYGGVIPPGEE